MRNGPLCWGMLVTGEAVHVCQVAKDLEFQLQHQSFQ